MDVLDSFNIVGLMDIFQQSQKQRIDDTCGAVFFYLEVFEPKSFKHMSSFEVLKDAFIFELQKKSKHFQH
jgi:hypothetical protein